MQERPLIFQMDSVSLCEGVVADLEIFVFLIKSPLIVGQQLVPLDQLLLQLVQLGCKHQHILALQALFLGELLVNIDKADELSLALFECLLQAFFALLKRSDLALEFLNLSTLLGDQLIFRMQSLLPGLHLAPQTKELLVFGIHCLAELHLNLSL